LPVEAGSAVPPVDAPTAPGRVLRRAGAGSVAAQALTLGVNLLTGILVARLLGTVGRGELTAVLTTTLFMATLFAAGAATAAPYHQAREPGDGARLVGTWLALTLPLGAVALVVGELLLPVVLAAQSETTLDLARLYLFSVFVLIAIDAVYGVAVGAKRFTLFNGARLAGPAALALGYLAVEVAVGLTVQRALVLAALVNCAVLAVGIAWARRAVGIGRPDRSLARGTLSYGLRAHATTVAERSNAHLDLLILPAFLGPAAVGLYAVAGSIAYVVAVLSSALATVVLPVAAGDPDRRARTVRSALFAALAAGTTLAAALALAGPWAIETLYGADFAGSVEPMRLLLPGSVLYGGTLVVSAGLNAAGRPGIAAVAQIVGAIITVAGLVAFLEDGGIATAAVVTTCAHAAAFAVALAVWLRAER
jgi:O-antigen/teichoic acid export membrane protein